MKETRKKLLQEDKKNVKISRDGYEQIQVIKNALIQCMINLKKLVNLMNVKQVNVFESVKSELKWHWSWYS